MLYKTIKIRPGSSRGIKKMNARMGEISNNSISISVLRGAKVVTVEEHPESAGDGGD